MYAQYGNYHFYHSCHCTLRNEQYLDGFQEAQVQIMLHKFFYTYSKKYFNFTFYANNDCFLNHGTQCHFCLCLIRNQAKNILNINFQTLGTELQLKQGWITIPFLLHQMFLLEQCMIVNVIVVGSILMDSGN